MNKGKELLLKMKSSNSSIVVGGHVFLNEPSLGQALGYFGYDFIWIDAEHGAFDKKDILSHVVFVNETDAAALVRVHTNHPDVIKQVLEMGVDGIIIPQIKTVEEAINAIKSCLYPPKGIRGFGPRRAQKYGSIPLDNYLNEAEDSFLRILQIEHVDAVNCIDDILEIDGLSALVIGPCDLSGSLNMLGDTLNPIVLDYAKKAINAAKKKNIPIGVSIAPDIKTIDIWSSLGVDFISCGDEISFLQKGAIETINYIKENNK
jgi:2-keto-3-deoxy-L-rhamnonate aldolase RhmA